VRPPRGPERGPQRATIPSRRSSRSPRSAPPTPTPQAARESAALTLKLTRLDREISATRAAGTGDAAPLASRRQDLRDRAIALAIEQTPAAERFPPAGHTHIRPRSISVG
jgi:hypothetical protein